MSIEIHGTVAPGFEAVRDAFAANWEQNGEVGASVSATLDGEVIFDLWGGTATYDDGERPWEEDTIINVWSTTKTMSFLCCLLLADRGELDLYAPVATYWPEFAAAGKEAGRHAPHHGPHRRPVRLGRAARDGRLPRPRQARRAPRRTGTVVGAGLGLGLSRDQPGLPARRDRQADRRASRSARSSPRRSPDRSAPTSTSAPAPSTTPASPT